MTTIEGLAESADKLHPMQEAFRENHALQCGFCTPGMVMSAIDMVKRHNYQLDERDGAPRARGQSLPLHRLPQHREGNSGRRASNEVSRSVTP